MRILVIEDDLHLADNLRNALEKERYSVDLCHDGEAGLFHITEYPLDMAVVDLGLPKIDGIELINKARAQGITIPILILTARDRWQDKVPSRAAALCAQRQSWPSDQNRIWPMDATRLSCLGKVQDFARHDV